MDGMGASKGKQTKLLPLFLSSVTPLAPFLPPSPVLRSIHPSLFPFSPALLPALSFSSHSRSRSRSLLKKSER